MLSSTNKKRWLSLACVLFALALGFLFWVPSKAPVKPLPQAKKPVVLEVWTLQLKSFAPYMEALFAAFEKEHPRLKVRWVDIPFQDAEKRALSAVLSDSVPDVMNLNPNFAALLAQRKTLLDLAPLLEPGQVNAYLPLVWKSLELEGQQIGLPWYLTSQVLFYNHTLLQKAGWKSPPQTMSDLLRLGADLKRCCPAAYSIMPNLGEGGQFLRLLQLTGVVLPHPKEGFSFHEQPKAVAFLQDWVTVYQKGHMPPESLSEGHQAAVERYQAGQLALLPAGVSLVSNLESNAPELFKQTSVSGQFLLKPTKKKSVADVASMILVLPRKGKHPKEALALALFMTRAQAQSDLADLAPILPSSTHSYPLRITKVATKKASAQPNRFLLKQAVRLSSQQLFAASSTVGLHPKQAMLNRFMDVAVQQALLKKKTPKEALAWFDEQVNRQL